MEKVMVIGCPGSGKSHFSRILHEKTGIPLYHLDLLYWNADETTVPKSIFLQRLDAVLQKERWIIDGNYGSTMERRMAFCDTVIFLDYPLEVCLSGIRQRRGKPRADMPCILGEDEAFLEFIKNYEKESRPQVQRLLERYGDKRIVIFKSRAEAQVFLERLS